jgi:hypothetical protein
MQFKSSEYGYVFAVAVWPEAFELEQSSLLVQLPDILSKEYMYSFHGN